MSMVNPVYPKWEQRVKYADYVDEEDKKDGVTIRDTILKHCIPAKALLKNE